jgi:hypothetical protein
MIASRRNGKFTDNDHKRGTSLRQDGRPYTIRTPKGIETARHSMYAERQRGAHFREGLGAMKTLLFAATLFLAAAAMPASATDNACLMHSYIDGWGTRGDHELVVNDRFGRKYLLTLAGYCADLDYSMAVGIRALGGGDFCVERGDRIVMRGGGAMGHNDSCWVTKIERYTPEMEKAYKAALEAKKNQPAP